MLSILIPTYNYDASKLIFELHSQLLREHIPFEIICIEDGSSTNIAHTEAFEAAKINYQQNHKNIGRTATRNKLARLAHYEWLLFLDADVIPSSQDFIKNYLSYLQQQYEVIIGGCAYAETHADKTTVLRWKYGKIREEIDCHQRNQNPYQHIFSGNLLIKKECFLSTNLSDAPAYGMDVVFAYSLFKENVAVLHINNFVMHLGLEKNEVFFKKSLKAVSVRKQFLLNKPEIEKISPLLRHYKRLKRYKLASLTKWMFIQTEPFLKKRILSANPSLFCLDLYRLGYLCLDKT
ncbi:MAG: glycosyltransferase family 2 protein [Flavobacteriaceae bacterium]|jgi:glycosyltransferase involved in cell wall biosynthesis|nr:glycosyltransferase family 2 protein [Flavobacteriaceae bacterium]